MPPTPTRHSFAVMPPQLSGESSNRPRVPTATEDDG